MKKVVMILIFSMIMFACSSKPTWDNMSEEAISAWKSFGVGAELANKFSDNQISPELYGEWKAVDLTDPEIVISWNESKFSAISAKSWITGGFSLDEAVENRAKGLSPVKKADSSQSQ